jgi:hypothetical protein
VVQTDLALTPEQVRRLTPLLDRLHAHRPTPISESKGSKRRQLAELAAACRREVGSVLTANQDRRLRQVFLQLGGPHVFSPGILDALGLTEPQKMEVRRLHAEATRASLWHVATAESRDEGLARCEDVWRQAMARVVADLTSTQRQRWAEMLGPPVRGKVHFPMPSSYRRSAVH